MDDINLVTINISAGEIVQPGSIIEIQASHPVDHRSAHGAIRLFKGGAPVNVVMKIEDKGHGVKLHTEGVEPGRYDLVVTELLDAKGKRLADRIAIPFAMAPFNGKLHQDRERGSNRCWRTRR